jgi:HEPN domain-containing protein
MGLNNYVLREDVYDWVHEAEADLERARKFLELGDYSMVCYLSQQAIKKSLKAIIIGFLREMPPHTNDLTALYSMVKTMFNLGEKANLLPEVSQYYITTRYPNAGIRRPSISFSRVQAE